jgi:hypothetical protein
MDEVVYEEVQEVLVSERDRRLCLRSKQMPWQHKKLQLPRR